MFKAEELTLAQQAAGLAIWEWSADTDELRWAPGSVKLFGCPNEEVATGEQLFLHICEEDRQRVRECLREALNSRADYAVEFRIELPNGQRRWLSANGRIVNRGEKIMVGVDRDITDFKAREEKLRAQARLLDLAYEPILVRDAEDKIQYWNKGAERLYGWSWREAKGQRSHDLLRTKFPTELPVIEREFTETGAWEGELVHTTKEGRYVHVASRWQRITDPGMFVLETNFDLSQQKAMELARAWKLKATLLGELAHEINNPLEAATGVAHILKNSCDPKSQQYLDVLEESIRRIAEFIRRSNDLHRNMRIADELKSEGPVQ